MIRIVRFVKWMNDNGAKFDKIRMKYYAQDYRGVHSFKKIPSGEMFLYVPKKLIITPQLGRETKIGTLVKKSGVKLSWDYLVYITIFLLEQFHDETSFWKPFMDVYPKNVDNFPMFYPEDEKALLAGSPMVNHVKNELQEIKEEYNSIVSAVPEFKKFTCDEYIKNKTLVISRIFFVKIHGNNDRIMVPLAGTPCILIL
jgi:histone-lysine N-methyltransferase SETD3